MNLNSPGRLGGPSPESFSSAWEAIQGLRNRRALLAMLGCLVAGVLVAGLFSLLASRLGVVIAFLGGLAMFIASAAGINAAGMLLWDQSRGLPPRPLADAVVGGLRCVPKFIGLALVLACAALAVFAVIAIVYLFCKIPLLGPVLFVVVFPLSVVAAGLALCGLSLCMFLALPAIWQGTTVPHALAQTLTIARTRGLEAVLMLAGVGLLAGVVGLIVFGVLFTGLMPTAGLAAAMLGGDEPGGLLGMMHGAGDGDAGGGYALAAGIGGALLWALAGTLVSLVYLLGLNLVYLRLIDGPAVPASPPTPTPTPAPPPRRSEPVPRPMPPEATAPAVAKASTCPQCLSAVGQGDAFCGVCGHRLA